MGIHFLNKGKGGALTASWIRRNQHYDLLFLTFLQDISQAPRDVTRRLAAVNVLDRSSNVQMILHSLS